MALEMTEKFLARLLSFAGAFITVFLISGSVTDPVNTPKMVALGVLGMAAITVVSTSNLKYHLREHKVTLWASIFFVMFMFISAIVSTAPLSQVLYGSYGRNNGLLTYLFLTCIFISALCLKSLKSFNSIVKGLLFAGIANLVYGLWVVFFGDFISWDNPYKSILGTFGNPNFIGAFLGIVFSSLLAIIFDSKSKKSFRIFSLLALPICLFEILNSNAIQGRIVAAFGAVIVVFLILRSNFKTSIVACYSVAMTIVGILALAGALQSGPLTQLIYKTSVSLRGQYWLAGWNTGQSHPFFGVGMDSFGDWYRRMRDVDALELPGVNTVVNAAHNVPLDIFAFGGWPLFILYILIIGHAGFAIVRVIIRNKKYNLTFSILSSAWAGYQLQSIISINQIGLAIWGWLLSGAVIAFERMSRETEYLDSNIKTHKKVKTQLNGNTLPVHIPVLATLGGLIGLLVALPPLTADVKWRSAVVNQTLPALEETMEVSYFNPANSMKYLRNIQTLEQSNLNELAREYTLKAINWNPDVFDFWRALYFIQASTLEDKKLAFENMKRLDPLNPDVTKA